MGTTAMNDETRWSLVRDRDGSADGSFVYAVRTTGVYCHPGCSSRRPRRENVVFFGSGREARRAGYRPCKRCRPDALEPEDRGARAVSAACRLIDECEGAPRLGELAAAVGYSPSHFHRLFREIVGVTPREYAAMGRMNRAREGLRGSESVTGVIYSSGYGASSRFYDHAAALLGMTPTEYRDGAEGKTIRVAVVSTYLGMTLVAATERGVCAIELGADARELVERLRHRFPAARLVLGDEQFGEWVAEVVAYLEAPRRGHSLPLDIQGTAFQRRVWRALRSVPAGATTTYSEIASRIGLPGGARAVAGACAANTFAGAIPCHRVVRKDGDPSGYRWGLERKRALLERESSGEE